LVRPAIACAAASFIPVEISLGPASRAPRKMPGNPSTLLALVPGDVGLLDPVHVADGHDRNLLQRQYWLAVFPVNVPNVLTVLRILAVPVLVVALLGETPDGDVIAAVVFALAALTDGLDGYIARRQQSVTTFGKLMDPLADKLLVVAALVSLVSLDRLAAWVAMVIIARELAVTGLRGLAVERGVVISASWLGKLKTLLQVAAVFALIIWNPAPVAVDILVYVAVAVTVISGADYFFGLRKRLAEVRSPVKAEQVG
jgi:CDP-diacylglycerol--glycerol-3-phosphate 3-phosphatidyltransferase